MKIPPITSRIRAPRQGFTLVELLIAIIILLFGVVAALKIFPPGFAAFSDAQMETMSQSLRDKGLNGLVDDADGLPDAIWPVEPSATTAIARALDFEDLRAVDFIGGPLDSWGVAHRYTFGADGWPEWQPLSARILRRVIGEKVVVPSSVNAFTDSTNNVFNLSRLPSYTPRFAPIEADTVESLLVYDTRYQQGDPADENMAKGVLRYSVVYNVDGSATFTFKQVNDRFIRLVLACTDASGEFVQVSPAVWNASDTTLTAPVQGAQRVNGQAITATVTANAGIQTFVLVPPAGCRLVPGSEQLNRAFQYVTTTDLATMEGLGARQFCLYTLDNPDPQYVGITKTLLSMLIFSRKDSGRKVKIDYIVADWGILHDDVTVDGDGFASLTALPRLNARANYPREARPWGLFEPMAGGEMNVVMTLVDLFSSNVFSVECDPDAKNKTYGPLEKGYRTNALLTTGDFSEKLIIDLSEAQQRRVRLGVLDKIVGDDGIERPFVNWKALAGQTFRVYYRAQRDWTVQFFRAPAVFGWTNSTDYLGWSNYAQDNANSIFVPGIYAGQSVAVDYQYRDTAQVTRAETTGTPTTVSVLYVNRLGSFAVGDSLAVFNVNSGTYLAGGSSGVTVHITGINRKERRLVLDSLLSVSAGDYLFPGDEPIEDQPLARVDNELHTIAAPDGYGVSRVLLNHLPADGTGLTVRGASVAVRTLWTQPRNGEAYIVDNDSAYSFPQKIRTINERWRGKTSVINLPMTGN